MSTDRQAVLRILDANANRAAEGLRVIEEYTRFALDDSHLTERCKSLRHDLTRSLAPISPAERHAARDTPGDVGTDITTAAETSRQSAADVWLASQKRVEQSLRCLEEYGKVVDPACGTAFESLRYRAYTLGKAIGSTTQNRERLAEARLYVLIDAGQTEDAFSHRVHALVEAGVDVIQLREKRLTDRALLARARRARAATRGTSTRFIMNDRVDLAVLADADGVHVGQDELTVAEARRILGPGRLVGVSTHNLQQARDAVLAGADYLGCGPTFESSTKAFSAFAGLEFLRAVAREIRLPAFAIGGITAENLPTVLATGFERVAVSGAIASAADPVAAVREIRALLRPTDPGARHGSSPG